MRVTILAAGLAACVGIGSVGCKSMPQMAWWKTASHADPESTPVARTAPALPSEIAKQAEGLGKPASVQITGGEASPFVPNTAPAAVASATASTAGTYPSTGATGYPTTTAPPIPAAAPPATTANLGSSALPYNPNAVPPAATASAAPITSPVPNGNRYASTSTPTAAAGFGGLNTAAPPRYANQIPAAQPPVTNQPFATNPGNLLAAGTSANAVTNSPTTTNANTLAANPSGMLGDRYAQTGALSAPATVSNAAPVGSGPVATSIGTTVASGSSYRPGGTGTYPTTPVNQPPIEVAMRPNPPVAGGTVAAPGQVPNLATPSGSNAAPSYYTPPQPSSYR